MPTILLLACLLQDEGVDKARKLIEESAARLKAAPAISIEYELIQGEAGADHSRVPTRATILVQLPDKMRYEWASSGYDQVQLLDGKNFWVLDRLKLEYSRHPQHRGTIKSRSSDQPLLRFYFDKEPARLLDRTQDVAVSSRKENGATFDVIAWRAKDPYRRSDLADYELWLDSNRLPRRFNQTWEWSGRLDMRSLEYTKIDLAPKLAADAFTFKPPEGAKEKPPMHGTGYEIPDTEEARKAQRLLIEIHKAFSATDALSYEVERTSNQEGDKPFVFHTTLKRADLIRQEMRSEGGTYATLADGDSMWTVQFGKNYTKRELTTAAHRLMIGVDPLIHLFFEGERPEVLRGEYQGIDVVQEKLDGETVDVIEWAMSQGESKVKYRFWVNSKRQPVKWTMDNNYKGKLYSSTFVYRAFDLKPAIPADHFTFKPGPDWTDRSDHRLGDGMIAVGKPAPDFEATDPAGARVLLSSFRGKPVVIVFGHYAHPSELERAQGFHDDFSKRGVAVLAVVVPQDKPPKLDSSKHTVTLLRLTDTKVPKTFGVDYMSGGMYLLDADGKVLAATYSNDDLKKAVDAAAGPAK